MGTAVDNQIDENTGGPARPARVPDLICLSHLRWDFVFQRPQHLMTRFAKQGRVYFYEEPIWDSESPRLEVRPAEENVHVVVPHLPGGLSEAESTAQQRELFGELVNREGIKDPVLWFYTPMALPLAQDLESSAVVYDCMDELGNFKFAPPMLKRNEAELFKKADLVFTGGQSLYEAKQGQHPHVYAFPSSVDTAHFRKARQPLPEPQDQASIPHPRIGFYGVLDERLDQELLDGVAQARPDWHLVMVGPIVKIDPNELPKRPNIHYLGGKTYQELPYYLAGWEAAMLPFARNDSTRFISPTKTPEYLAAGRPVISTSIRDVVRPYGVNGLVHIADSVDDFVRETELALQQRETDPEWLTRVDAFLAQLSWDRTWAEMNALIQDVVRARRSAADRNAADVRETVPLSPGTDAAT